jgi:hypothetical protein
VSDTAAQLNSMLGGEKWIAGIGAAAKRVDPAKLTE